MLTDDGRLLDLLTKTKRPKIRERSVIARFFYRRGATRPYSQIGLAEAESESEI
jgi:hypothetical protein